MQYLKNFEDKLNFIEESEWDFLDIFSLSEYVEGLPNKDLKTFNKFLYPEQLIEEDNGDNKYLVPYNAFTSGVALRFDIDTSEIIIKAKLKRAYAYTNINLSCSSGFDIYSINKSQIANHITIVAPDEPNTTFAHLVNLFSPRGVEIYFPTYNQILDFQLGIKKGTHLSKLPPRKNDGVVCFYGNSRTQGASASRSGNTFPNIVSRKLNTEIYNYSFSAACRGEKSAAQQILDNLNRQKRFMSAFVLDFQQNAISLSEFEERFFPFYKIIREAYPSIPIIIINGFCSPWYDKHIKAVLKEIKDMHEHTFFIDLNELFKSCDLVSLTIDRLHYTDEGMYPVADKICEYIRQSSPLF